MNYRHSYHAGNIADVFKHIVLTQCLQALQQKPAAFCVLDSHAGSGLYPLPKTGEYSQGIGNLWPSRQQWPALAEYFSLVEKCNPTGELKFYPGSPWLIRECLRGQDRGVFLELHAQEHANLKEILAADKRLAVHHQDAWSGLKAFIPPKENRGLVLIDPPYEQTDEFKRIETALSLALKHWRNGTYLVWYPIKGRIPVERFYARLARLGVAKQTIEAVEFLTLPTDMENRLNGSGLIIINSPWRVLDSLRESLPPLARYLAGPAGKPAVNFLNLGKD